MRIYICSLLRTFVLFYNKKNSDHGFRSVRQGSARDGGVVRRAVPGIGPHGPEPAQGVRGGGGVHDGLRRFPRRETVRADRGCCC